MKKAQHAAAAKRSRQRKSAGQPVRKRHSAAELVALEAKPLEQRTAEEKEAVRNHRKELKRKEKAATGAAALANAAAPVPPSPAAPPPTRSPSPVPPLSLLPLTAAAPTPTPVPASPPLVRNDSLLLNSADLEEILGRPLSPALPVAPAAACMLPFGLQLDSLASSLPLPSFPPPPPPPPPPAAAASADTTLLELLPSTSSSAAAAAAMSSASKLRASVMKKRASQSMSVLLLPNAKRQTAGEQGHVKIGAIEEEPASDEDGTPALTPAYGARHRTRPAWSHDRVLLQLQADKATLAAAYRNNPAWQQQVQSYADIVYARRVADISGSKGKGHQIDESYHRQRILQNVQHHVAEALRLGCDEPHRPEADGGCRGAFYPLALFDGADTNFAHYKATSVRKQRGETGKTHTAYELGKNIGSSPTDVFMAFRETGRMKWSACHGHESRSEATSRT